MLIQIKETLGRHLVNLPGWRTSRKIVVFESDDWGSQRMPSIKALNALESNGLKLRHLKFATHDILEKREDLDALINLLISFKKSDRTPIISTNMVMANPNYEYIKKDRFETFHYLDLNESYDSYNGERLNDTWEKGISEKVIQPEFHAREHLNRRLWIKDLKNNVKLTRIAFEHKFFGQIEGTSSTNQSNYLMSYYTESMTELEQVKMDTLDGINLFKDVFKRLPNSFVASNYVWPVELEAFLYENGVRFIQSQRVQIAPLPSKRGRKKKIYHYTGQQNSLNQTYIVRNVQFEPFMNQNEDWVDKAMKQIQNSFFWGKPAIIATHRANYVSGLNVKNRDESLKKLNSLIKRLFIAFPDIEFMSTNELLFLNEK